MKVSIITVTYNSEGTVGDTLRSIRGQTYPDIEVIVVDGCSKDNTVAIVKEFECVSRIICEPDSGIYDAMNKGLRIASGDIVGILNSDDFYQDEAVIAHVVRMFQEQSLEGLYGDLCYVDSLDTDRVLRQWVSGGFSGRNFLYGWMPPHPTFFVRRAVYERYGLFDPRFKSSADYEIMLRFMHKYKIKVGYLPRVMVRMRVGGKSNASLRNRLKANREDAMAWKINGLRPFIFTRYLKPVRKIGQFLGYLGSA